MKKTSARPVLSFRLFMLAVCLMAFAALEVLTRVFILKEQLYIISSNPRLIYELNPKHSQINSAQMRQAEVELARLEDDFVIAVVGDSHAYSVESEDRENSFPARLEHHLGRVSGKNVRVLNFGVPGYNTLQELEVLRTRVLPLKVDLVILQYCSNDERISFYIRPEYPGLNRLFHQSEFLAGAWKRLIYSELGAEYLVPFIEDTFPDLLLYRPGLVASPGPRAADVALGPDSPGARSRVFARYRESIGRENLERNTRTFGAMAKSAGVPLIATGFIEDRDRSLYEEAGFQVYSFLEIFRGLDMHDFGYDPAIPADHFADRGSDFIGKALADFVKTKLGDAGQSEEQRESGEQTESALPRKAS